MNVGDLARIIAGGRAGMTGVCLSLSPLYAELRLTSTNETVTVPRVDLLVVDRRPMTVAQWRAEHGTWRRRNARVIARMVAAREERGVAA